MPERWSILADGVLAALACGRTLRAPALPADLPGGGRTRASPWPRSVRRKRGRGLRGNGRFTIARGEEGIDERSGRHECGVGALVQKMERALDARDAAHPENGAVPRARLAPRQHFLDLPSAYREGIGAAGVRH